MKPVPSISVIVPVYNGARYLSIAIQSLLTQTLGNIEIIIINDCSQDNSWEIIKALGDNRIIKVNNTLNQGVSYCRNLGVSKARAEYISFLDYDDIAYPSKLEKQLHHFKKHPYLSAVGTLAQGIDENGAKTEHINGLPLTHKESSVALLFDNNFVLSSMLFRKEIFNTAQFDAALEPAEDYFLLCETAPQYAIDNLPEVLCKYRRHTHSVSITKAHKMSQATHKIACYQLKKLGLHPTDLEYHTHKDLSVRYPKSLEEIKNTDKWLQKILSQNRCHKQYPCDILKHFAQNYWHACCLDAYKTGMDAWSTYWSSPLAIKGLTSPYKTYQLAKRLIPIVLRSNVI